MSAGREISRGLLVTAIAAGGGGMLGVLLLGGNPFGGLSVVPFTLFGSLVVLLPVYLGFRDIRKSSIRVCYAAVAASGVLGGWLILNALTGFIAYGVGQMGALFGFATSVFWIVAHHLSRSRSARS
jgi:hypothetical protein